MAHTSIRINEHFWHKWRHLSWDMTSSMISSLSVLNIWWCGELTALLLNHLPSQKIYSPLTNGVDFFQALRTMTLCRYLHVLDKWWIQIWSNYTKVSGKNFLINLIVYTNIHYYSTMILYLPVHLLSNFH